MIRNDERRWGAVAQTLHWLIAALVLTMFGLGWYMSDLPLGPHRSEMVQLHRSLGLTILALALVRLAWCLFDPAPPLPTSLPGWERRAAHASHFLLYALLFVQPAIGFLQANAANAPVAVWGVLPLPALLAPDETLANSLIGVHEFVASVLAALVLIHVGAALRHQFWLKDDIMRRMLPGALLERPSAGPGGPSPR